MTRPWTSGFCIPGNPADSHGRCAEHPRKDGVECACRCHATVDLITPTGLLVTDAEPESDTWFAARRGGITGTDLPKILGLTKYGNALSVWLDKRGELPADAGDMEAAEWGHILEDPVAQKWSRTVGAVVEPIGVVANAEHSWRRASLDRIVLEYTCEDGDGPCGLEVKTRSAFKAAEWRDGIPDDVLAQTTWGLLVTGLHHMHVAALIGGQRLKSFRVDRDEKLEAYLIDAATTVWDAVESGTPPETHPDSDGVLLDLLDRLYESRAGARELPPESVDWIEQYAEGNELERRGKALKTQAKTALVQAIDDGEEGLLDDVLVFTYRPPAPVDTITADNLRALRESTPEVYDALRSDGFITTTNPRPRFDLKRKKEKA